MEQDDLLRFIADQLNQLAIPYFVTGSIAAAFYGEFRMTNDIDVVVDLRPDQIDTFLSRFPADQFYSDRDAIVDAVRNGFQFNLIHKSSFAKADFIVTSHAPHDREQFRRVSPSKTPNGPDITYCTPEDLILKKLQCHRDSNSDKHLRDAAGILKVSRASLNMKYLDDWADWLDVRRSWRLAQQLASS